MHCLGQNTEYGFSGAGNEEWMEVLTAWSSESRSVVAPSLTTTQALAYILYDPPSSSQVLTNDGDVYTKVKKELVDWIEYKDQVRISPAIRMCKSC
jgi:hypothetical protein